jgi:hypothetical protein
VLIVAIKSKMQAAYGSQLNTLETKVEQFITALGEDRLGGMFLYLDDEKTSDIIGRKVQSPDDWNDINTVLDLLIPKLKAKYLIILGGDARFPQANFGVVLYGSDDPYGDTDGDGNYIPDIPVGRIPDPRNGDLAVILNSLDTSIKLHQSGGLDLTSKLAPIMGCGIGEQNWNSGKCFCSDALGIASCAGSCDCISHPQMSGKDFVMILAHGPGPSPDDFYRGGCMNMNPSDVSSLDVSNAMWMPMSCGGGHIRQKTDTSHSIVMTFLKQGGAVYVGSTADNYGGFGGCPVPGGDGCVGSLYVEIYKSLKVGKTVGDAYKEGKAKYATSSTYDCPIYGKYYQYHINVLYGDPTLKIKRI